MKRIIALILSIVMIFSLCTVSVTVQAEGSTEIAVSGANWRDADLGTVAAYNVAAQGLAGKNSDDTVKTITINDDLGDAYINGGYPRYEINHNFGFTSSTEANTEATFRFSIYADGDVVAGCSLHTRDVLRWDADGSLYGITCDYSSWAMTFDKIATLERGRWHTIAITFVSGTWEQKIYADGEYLGSFTRPNYPFNTDGSPKHTTMKIGAYNGSGDGVIAIDDVYSLAGAYDAASDTIAVTADDVIIDNENKIITYNEKVFADASSLKAYLLECSNANEINICDKNFSLSDEALPGDGLCLMVPPSGIGFYTYKLQAMFYVDDADISINDGYLSVKAKVVNNHSSARKVTMILALKDKYGCLAAIYPLPTESVLGTKELSIENVALNDCIAQIFFVEDLDSLTPVARDIKDVGLHPVCLNGKIFDVDFSVEPAFTIADKGNIIERYTESDANTALLYERNATTDFHTDILGIQSYSESVVYEYDIKLLNASESNMLVSLLSDFGTESRMTTLAKGGTITLGRYSQKLSEDTWYNIAAVYNFYEHTRSFYVNGKIVCENEAIDASIGNAANLYMMRLQVPANPLENNHTQFLIDDIRVYETKAPMQDISNLERIITLNRDFSVIDDGDFSVYPDEEAVKSAYANSPNKGVHPRIHATAADFERLRTEIQSGNKKKLYDQIISRANEYVAEDVPVKYELRDGTRLLDVCRDVLRNMYVLGMAYQLSGDTKYVDRAWTDLEAVSNFPDWHPNHALDPAEMSAAVSIGYDWMYHALTPEQRRVIEKGVYNNLFYVTCNSIQHKNGYLTNGLLTDMNHNLVINGGVSMGAMCFMDVYPEISTYILSNSLRSVGKAICNYGPDGAWVEGPHYWEYSTQYTTKLLATLDTAMGTDFHLSEVEGLSDAASFILHLQSDIGIFNYGDGAVAKQYVPEILWLANKYDLGLVTPAWLELSQLNMNGYEDRVLALLWLDADATAAEVTMPLDAFYEGENVVTFRDKWTNKNGTFVGIHGGETIVNHSHLDGGSFVFDSMGVRWACDPGMGPYDLPNYWDIANGGRWKYYMTRAEAHNSVIINPDAEPDHNPFSKVTIDRFETGTNGGIAVADTSELYSDDALSARRGFFFTDDRQSLIIRDEITLKEQSDVYWFMQTKADVTVTDDGAVLTYGGKQLKLEAMGDTELEITVGASEPLPTSPVMENDLMPSGMKRIAIKLTSSGDTALTVKLTPYDIDSADISDYHKSIDLWNIPDDE